jgi:hypothetical protein
MADRRRRRLRPLRSSTATPPGHARPAPSSVTPATLRWSRGAVAAATLCGLVPLAVYVATLHPAVAGGDSGEVITVARVLGVAHPPGYPLHTLLARLTALLPAGTFAWRVNLLSALCDAGAAVLLFRATSLWSGSLAAGVLAAGVFAFSPLIWPYATTAEVFALNNLFVAGLLALSARAVIERETAGATSTRTLYVAAFWLGLGFSNHHTLVFFGVPFGVFLLVMAGRRAMAPRFMLGLAAAHVAGFLPFAYLPLAAAAHPPVTWGDTASWQGVVTHFLRREYGTFKLAESSVGDAGALWPRFALFWLAAARGALVAAVPLVVASLLVLARRGHARVLAGLWIIALLFYLVVFCSLANLRLDEPLHVFMQERFWQQGIVVVSALAGVGLAEATRWLGQWGAWVRWPMAVALPLALVVLNAPAVAAHSNPIIRDYSVAVLDSLPPDAILVVSSDEAVNGVRYLQEVEGRRRDVRVLPVGILTFPWFRAVAARHMPGVALPAAPFTFRALLDANIDRAPIFVCNRVPWMQTLEDAYALWPMGLVERVLPKARPPDLASLVATAQAGFARLDPDPALMFPAGSWERAVGLAYWRAYERLGFAVARLATGRRDDPATHELTIRVFETLARRDPSPPPVVWKNLGVAYHAQSATRREALAPMVAAWRRYLEVAPPDDPDLANIRLLIVDAERTSTGATGAR